jgi:multidrug efflux pump subunit AcrB
MLMPAWQFIRPPGLNGPLSMFGVELKMLPNDNTNTMLLQVDMPAGTALAATDQVARAVGEVVGKHPHVTDYQTFLGMTAPIDFAALVRGDMIKRGSNLAQIRVNFVDKHHRGHRFARHRHPARRSAEERAPAIPRRQDQALRNPARPAGAGADPGRAVRPGLRPAARRGARDQSGVRADLRHGQRRQLGHRQQRQLPHPCGQRKGLLSGVAPGQVAKLLRDYVSAASTSAPCTSKARANRSTSSCDCRVNCAPARRP